jgi:two-component system chemotaxis response regulator CheB
VASPRSLLVIGASAGGVEPLRTIVAGLPRDLPAAVGVVLHVSPNVKSRLPAILTRAGLLQASRAEDGEPLQPGHIYVAPPDRHLLIRDGRCAVVRGPRENNARPAIDPLFRSAASSYGSRAVAVVLSGSLGDGSAGADAVSRVGGTVIVQEPSEAIFPDMPSNAIARDHPDYVLPLADIAPTITDVLIRLSQEGDVSENEREEMMVETSYSALDQDALDRDRPPGAPSPFSCPECGGVLWEIEDGELPRFRCRVGHGYSAESAIAGQGEVVEDALWAALRALHERAALAERVANRVRRHGSGRTADRFDAIAREALEQAELIRNVLLEQDGGDR